MSAPDFHWADELAKVKVLAEHAMPGEQNLVQSYQASRLEACQLRERVAELEMELARSPSLPDDPGSEVTGADYYILDARSCVGNCASWWRPKGNGYCCKLDEAGLYTLKQALSHRRGIDVPVHKDIARRLVVQHVRWDHLGQAGVTFKGPGLDAYLESLQAKAPAEKEIVE